MHNAECTMHDLSYPLFMSDEPPTAEQQSRIDKLTAEHIRLIDEAILENASTQWRKVARVIGSAMPASEDSVPRVPDLFYAERVRHLVAAGKLESQGNLEYMRSSEVRLSANSGE